MVVLQLAEIKQLKKTDEIDNQIQQKIATKSIVIPQQWLSESINMQE